MRFKALTEVLARRSESRGVLAGFRDRILDTSVYFSFDASGFDRHARRFDEADLDVDLTEKRCLVTGANSGIGKQVAQGLAERGADLTLLCRNPVRGEQARADITALSGNNNVKVVELDLADLSSVRRAVAQMALDRVDVLINNAGVLPNARIVTKDGLELTWSTNVAGPFLLTDLLAPALKASPDARIVNVSSGGMYTQRLDLTDILWENKRFDGVVAYAQTKRAEVILTELWAEQLKGVAVHAMHPGWVDTPGVQTSLPRFHRFTKGRLRSPEQGADTMLWLAVAAKAARSTGQFWFDREPAFTHVLPNTRESQADRDALWRLCRSYATP